MTGLFMIAAAVPSPVPPEVVEMTEAFFATIIVIALGIPIIRAITKRFDRPAAPSAAMLTAPADTTARLERIEQAVEAIAIEVERIAESQRFSAKLMAEQQRSLPRADSGQ